MIGVALVLFWLQKDLGPALLCSRPAAGDAVRRERPRQLRRPRPDPAGRGRRARQPAVQHVHTRVEIWLDPWAPRHRGYQLVQALYALASGGVFGTGLDMGSPRYIPAVHTDFVIAAIGEELGLVGTLAVVNLFVCSSCAASWWRSARANGFSAAARGRL